MTPIAPLPLPLVVAALALAAAPVARADDAAPTVAGQDHGAPAVFRPKRILAQMTISAAVCFVLYYIAYVNGWADPNVLSGRA